MSGVDPLAAAAAGSIDDAALAAMIDAELAQLAADANALGALLVEGVVVNARVLPSNGLTDLLEIAGRRVAASLPPTVRPGDVLQVKVTGFEGGRILLQVVATGADAAVEPGPRNVPLAPDPAAFVAASIRPAATAANVANATPAAPGGASPATSAPAPPAGAAPLDELLPPAVAPTRPGVTAQFTSAVSRANVAAHAPGDVRAAPTAPSSAAPPRAAVVPPGEPSPIEARVAASRATVAPPSAAPAAPDEPAAAPVRPAQPFVAPPQIGAKAAIANMPPAPRATGLAAYTQPVALLRALKLPVTPSNVASAALALQEPDRVPAALAALEAALPAASADAQIATLRTLLTFVGRIEPQSPALAAQIAAYVEHVVDGAEPKLVTLLAAAREAERVAPAAQQPSNDAPAVAAPQSPPQQSPVQQPAAQQAPAQQPPLPAAVVAERGAALGADLKQTLLTVAADAATPASLAPSLAGALTALTAVQVHAAQSLAAHPEALAFTIPLATQHGPASAQITVQRDVPQRRGIPVDGENFRVAFVLDTAHYGTVAIDLVTVGRDVTVDVRTDSAPAMRAFRGALGTLTARLESLRYRVASAGASLGPPLTVAVDAPPAPAADLNANVDRSA